MDQEVAQRLVADAAREVRRGSPEEGARKEAMSFRMAGEHMS